jgi:hypothetical protein
MDQVVSFLGRMNSYESRGSVSFPDLNAPFNLSTRAACTINEPCSEGREKRNLFCLHTQRINLPSILPKMEKLLQEVEEAGSLSWRITSRSQSLLSRGTKLGAMSTLVKVPRRCRSL